MHNLSILAQEVMSQGYMYAWDFTQNLFGVQCDVATWIMSSSPFAFTFIGCPVNNIV